MTRGQIRRMRWWDLELVHAIEIEAFPQTAWSLESFWGELAQVSESAIYYVTDLDGTIVGYAGVGFAGAEADVRTIAVAAQFRRLGIGQALLRQLERAAVQRRSARISLEVRVDNREAHLLYTKSHYEVSATRRDYYGRGSDAYLMQRRLDATPGAIADRSTTNE